MGGRSDLFNSGGRWSKGGGIFSKFRGELAKRGVKKFRGGGVWTVDEAMVQGCFEIIMKLLVLCQISAKD